MDCNGLFYDGHDIHFGYRSLKILWSHHIQALASEYLYVVTVDENEYEDNHMMYVANQRQGGLLRKIWGRISWMLYLNTSQLEL